jgi:enoyl-CoA hydratase/carnithine racemase
MTVTILLVERLEGTLVLTLNRPEALNALSTQLAVSVRDTVQDACRDDGIRSILITGGARAFSAGTDLKQRSRLHAHGKWRQSRALWDLTQTIWQAPCPVVAAIGGWCLGGGLELALSCDFRIAAADACFGWPEMTLGAYPGGGAAVTLPRTMRLPAAKEMFFTARRLTASEALRYGLVDRVVPAPRLRAEALGFAERLHGGTRCAVAAAKLALNECSAMA